MESAGRRVRGRAGGATGPTWPAGPGGDKDSVQRGHKEMLIIAPYNRGV